MAMCRKCWQSLRHCECEPYGVAEEASASPTGSTADETIERLRGQLQNCVTHLERAKRRNGGSDHDAAIESANRALYETMSR